MKVKADDGKPFYDLWFILEKKGANRDSVLKAKCICKGHCDGSCKHIGAAMQSLEDLLHTCGKDSVTSGCCSWAKRPTSSTKACEVSELIVEKCKYPSSKKKKKDYVYCQNIDVDVRAVQDRKPKSKQRLRRQIQGMVKMESRPAILPLLEKLYPAKTTSESSKRMNASKGKFLGIMKYKVQSLYET